MTAPGDYARSFKIRPSDPAQQAAKNAAVRALRRWRFGPAPAPAAQPPPDAPDEPPFDYVAFSAWFKSLAPLLEVLPPREAEQFSIAARLRFTGKMSAENWLAVLSNAQARRDAVPDPRLRRGARPCVRWDGW